MTYVNYEWLGFAPTPESALTIIKQTGVFYVTVSVAYFLSFLHMLWHSSSTGKVKKTHCLTIVLWAFVGVCLLYQPHTFSFVLNFLITLLAFIVLYHLHVTSALTSHVNLDFKSINTDDKKALYTKTLLKKMDCTLTDVFGFTLINEQILWMVIFYRAAIGMRAAFAL